jgi:hypothetical protein
MKYASSLFVAALLVVGATAAHAENTVCKTVKTGDCHRTIDGTETCTPVFKEVCLPFVPDTSDDPHAGMTRRQIDREERLDREHPRRLNDPSRKPKPAGPKHCEIETGRECNRSIDGGESCRPVFREVCLPVVADD